jgi:hypothetical protein
VSESGAVIVLDEHIVIYALPEAWSGAQSSLAGMQERLAIVGKELGYRFLVIPGPAVAFDFRGNETLQALAETVAEEIEKALVS